MFPRSTNRCLSFALGLALLTSTVTAEEVLLEDYQHGGCFSPADWANTFSDGNGNSNESWVSEKVAVVQWATQWSGLPSNGEAHDFSKFKTFQADVMVEEGQPVEEGANFYFQLLNETGAGYSYWEAFVPQDKVPADGKWHRVQFPLTMMAKGFGDGGEAPTDFSTVIGTVCGMTFDEEGNDKFQPKQAQFDNLMLLDSEIEEVQSEPVAEKAAE